MSLMPPFLLAVVPGIVTGLDCKSCTKRWGHAKCDEHLYWYVIDVTEWQWRPCSWVVSSWRRSHSTQKDYLLRDALSKYKNHSTKTASNYVVATLAIILCQNYPGLRHMQTNIIMKVLNFFIIFKHWCPRPWFVLNCVVMPWDLEYLWSTFFPFKVSNKSWSLQTLMTKVFFSFEQALYFSYYKCACIWMVCNIHHVSSKIVWSKEASYKWLKLVEINRL